MDSTDILNKLRQHHARDGAEGMWFGVNVMEGKCDDMMKKYLKARFSLSKHEKPHAMLF